MQKHKEMCGWRWTHEVSTSRPAYNKRRIVRVAFLESIGYFRRSMLEVKHFDSAYRDRRGTVRSLWKVLNEVRTKEYPVHKTVALP